MTRFMLALVPVIAVAAFVGPANAQTACHAKVMSTYDNPFLRIEMNSSGNIQAIEDAKLHLWRAQRSAELGNEAACWNQLGWADYFVKPPTN